MAETSHKSSDIPQNGAYGQDICSGREPGHFCDTDEIRAIVTKGVTCLAAGVPVHLCGPAGIGKTALAVRMAAEFDRPMSLLTGHEGLSPEDIIGQQVGHSEFVVVDKYIQSVRRKQTQSRIDWRDAILVEAMRNGHTLVYDEFTRASPATNVLLLSVLEEGVLVSASALDGHSYIHAHPDFRVILTSNPADYVAVNAAPDALLDRMVTVRLDGYSGETEAEIVRAATGLEPGAARRIVEITTSLRKSHPDALLPSMRSSILIGKIVRSLRDFEPQDDARLAEVVATVARGRAPDIPRDMIDEAVRSTAGNDTRTC